MVASAVFVVKNNNEKEIVTGENLRRAACMGGAAFLSKRVEARSVAGRNHTNSR
jgi:hypothetical protein